MYRSIALVILLLSVVVPSWEASAQEPNVVVAASIQQTDDSWVLQVHAKIREGLHIYAQSQPKPFLATRLTLTEASEGVQLDGVFTPDHQPHFRDHATLEVPLHEFEDAVTWSAPLKIEGDSRDFAVRGTLVIQACEAERCFAPKVYTFEASVGDPTAGNPIVSIRDSDPTASLAPSAGGGASTDAAFRLDNLELEATRSTKSIWAVLPLAFLAGFLLNFMPCVLPVVALKLLSFVEQAQSDRRRIMLMNLSYTGGVLLVMLVLATLAVFAGLGWGEQFSSTGFTITLAAIVFAFGLSFLGVWEIPLPGFVSTAGGKTPSEGYSGAFSKGILSTVLATPCSGPFLGAALAWAVTQPTLLTYTVFVTVGLGMASPYLVIGAFPSLIRHLPRPGNWMVTFKYLMGFVMLGTVVYLLSFAAIASVVPTMLLLLGVAVAVWFAGQTPYTAAASHKMRAWGIATAIILASASVSFGWLEGVMQERFERAAMRFASDRLDTEGISLTGNEDGIAWEEYSPERLETAIASGHPVFVDFTADWCLTCKANEAAAVNTKEVAQALRDNDVVALRADKTEANPEVDGLLRKLGNSAASIPFYAVFHPGNPGEPVLLDGVFASSQPFVDALQCEARKSTEIGDVSENVAAVVEDPGSRSHSVESAPVAEQHSDAEIVWQDYTPDLMKAALDSGRPVFVDFTADWCVACKKNHATAIETDELRAAIQTHNVATFIADKTDDNPDADVLLKQFGNKDGHIPFYAIIHPENPDAPVVLDGVLESSQPFVDAIQGEVREPTGASESVTHAAEDLSDAEIAWQDYSPARLKASLDAGHPVFVDFTADWCVACKKNHAAAIETDELRAAIQTHNVVALIANQTNENPDADAFLKQLGNKDGHIPFYAIIHPENPDAPVVLDGVLKSSKPFVDAIQGSTGE